MVSGKNIWVPNLHANTVGDPGEGPGGRGPLGPKWGPKDRKKIFLDAGPPLISGSVYSFKYGVNKLNNVKSYKYLGTTLNPYGNFSLAREELKKLGLKALYKLRKEMGDNFRENIMLTIKLFDALISPILLYGSEIWGVDCNDQIEKDPAELVQIKFLKWLLGVNKYCSNNACRA